MSQAPIDKSTIDQVNRLLAQTGERERLKDMLRSKLVECGWTDRVQTECFSNKIILYLSFLIFYLDEIKSKGVDKISPQELYENMSIKAKGTNIKLDRSLFIFTHICSYNS